MSLPQPPPPPPTLNARKRRRQRATTADTTTTGGGHDDDSDESIAARCDVARRFFVDLDRQPEWIIARRETFRWLEQKALDALVATLRPTLASSPPHDDDALSHHALSCQDDHPLYRSIVSALVRDGATTSILRSLCIPMLSQDRFSLVCPTYRKSREKTGVPYTPSDAADVARAAWPFLDEQLIESPCMDPTHVVWRSIARHVASDQLQSVLRSLWASDQESDLAVELVRLGYVQSSSSSVTTLDDVSPGQFVCNVKLATRRPPTTTTTTDDDGDGDPENENDNDRAAGSVDRQEADVALRLWNGRVWLFECKTTNDATNSVKRTNDVYKKCMAWPRDVTTVAVFQGVVQPSDIRKLRDIGVATYFSHELDRLCRDLARVDDSCVAAAATSSSSSVHAMIPRVLAMTRAKQHSVPNTTAE